MVISSLSRSSCLALAATLAFASIAAAATPHMKTEAELNVIAKQVVRANGSVEALSWGTDNPVPVQQDDTQIWFYLGVVAVCGAAFEIVRQCRNQVSGNTIAAPLADDELPDQDERTACTDEWRTACMKAMKAARPEPPIYAFTVSNSILD